MVFLAQGLQPLLAPSTVGRSSREPLGRLENEIATAAGSTEPLHPVREFGTGDPKFDSSQDQEGPHNIPVTASIIGNVMSLQYTLLKKYLDKK